VHVCNGICETLNNRKRGKEGKEGKEGQEEKEGLHMQVNIYILKNLAVTVFCRWLWEGWTNCDCVYSTL
jgi:hypothetical protein